MDHLINLTIHARYDRADDWSIGLANYVRLPSLRNLIYFGDYIDIWHLDVSDLQYVKLGIDAFTDIDSALLILPGFVSAHTIDLTFPETIQADFLVEFLHVNLPKLDAVILNGHVHDFILNNLRS